MNDIDLKVLGILLRYSQRRMLAVMGQLESGLGVALDGSAPAASAAPVAMAAVARLEREGLVYTDGVTVRLTLAGFAHAASAAAVTAETASVHRLGRRSFARRTPRSRAA